MTNEQRELIREAAKMTEAQQDKLLEIALRMKAGESVTTEQAIAELRAV